MIKFAAENKHRMSVRTNRNDRGLDWMTFSLYLSMLGVGWLMVYTVGYGKGYPSNFLDLLSSTPVGKQTIWIGVSFLILFFTQIIGWKFWRTFAYPIYGVGLFLLVAVLFFGNTIKGATSWFAFGGFSFQPAEIAKFGTCLALSSFLNDYNTNLKHTRYQLQALGLLIAPILLILLQPDAGSALVFLSFFIMLFREGMPANYFALGFGAAALLILGLMFPPAPVIQVLILAAITVLLLNFKKYKIQLGLAAAVLAGLSFWAFLKQWEWWAVMSGIVIFTVLCILQWMRKKERVVILMIGGLVIAADLVYMANYAFNNFLQAHQKERINVWLNPSECDPRGSLYNVLQSKMAIGSGGWQGKGFLQGTMTKLNYVPEQSTDFIFCTIGEEQGFLGVVSIVGLFLLLLYRITVLAERQRSDFTRHYAYGVVGIIFIHVFINIGMTMGLMPIIGIPLPFISYGGSSLLGFSFMLGVLLKLDAHRSEP